jgi:hypothetical protein
MTQPTFSGLGHTSHVNILLDVKELVHSYPIAVTVHKRPPTLQAGGTKSFPPSPRELLKLSSHPIVTSVHLQYQTTRRRAITSEEGLEPG